MKQFIVFLAVFPLMLAFLLQFTLQQSMDARMERADQIVYAAKAEAMIQGGFSHEMVESLRSDLAEAVGCQGEEISIVVSEDTKYRTGISDEREMIECRVTMPLGRIMAFGSMFGIDDDENRALYVMDSSFPSELLM